MIPTTALFPPMIEAEYTRLTDGLEEAARYVRKLMPPPLDAPVKADWVFQPSAELGGDALGYAWLDDDHFAFYLLDVTGHGIGAALHSVSVMNMLRAQTLRAANFCDPGAVLATLNDVFPMKQYDDRFFTIWYGLYHQPTRRLTFASGGHPPALLVRDGNPQIVPLRTRGLLVGGVPDARYPTASVIVPPGSTLYLFSDGVYEVQRRDGTVGTLDEFIDLLPGLLAENPASLQTMATRILQAQHCKTCADDFALLRLRFD